MIGFLAALTLLQAHDAASARETAEASSRTADIAAKQAVQIQAPGGRPARSTTDEAYLGMALRQVDICTAVSLASADLRQAALNRADTGSARAMEWLRQADEICRGQRERLDLF